MRYPQLYIQPPSTLPVIYCGKKGIIYRKGGVCFYHFFRQMFRLFVDNDKTSDSCGVKLGTVS